MNLFEITKGFSGILVIGDLHGDVESLILAIQYARKENLFIISLGDLVDRGPFPFETVELILSILDKGEGAFVIGNHDNKHYRYAIGHTVIFSNNAKNTLLSVGEDRNEAYLENYRKLYEHSLSALYHYIGDWVFVHGATHLEIWDYPETISNNIKSCALYGEVNGKSDQKGFPVRLYNWINDIPAGKSVIVGHDRKAMYDIKLEVPLIVKNDRGGLVIFADTSCGKGGTLSGVVLKFNERVLLDRIVQFKN